MKMKLFAGAAILVLVATVAATIVIALEADAANGTWGGHGTQTDPYLINDAADLKTLADNVNSGNYYIDTYFLLTSDVNLGVAPYNTGKGWIPIGYDDYGGFCGIFDGGGHIIKGLYINNADYENAGLFGLSAGDIKNLGVVGASVTISNNSENTAYYVGGVVGANGGTIKNCYFTGTINCNFISIYPHSIGGVVGVNVKVDTYPGMIENCYSTGTISYNGSVLAGGVVGASNGVIKNCYNTGTISGNGDTAAGGTAAAGGVAGVSEGAITNCYNTGSVSGTGHFVGGVVGLFSGTISNCFFLQDAGINSTLSGLGYLPSNSGATPITSTQMKTKFTFTDAGWDFNNIWTIAPGKNNGYPTFTSTSLPVIQHPTGVALDKSTLPMKVGSSLSLTATVYPSDAADKSVTWSSSNTSIATVSGSGVVTAVGAGTAIITAKTNDGNYTAGCTVTVILHQTGVALDKSTLSLEIGDNSTLTVMVSPAIGKSVTWSSSNTSVATVSSNGVVTAVNAGTATITAKTIDGGYEANCTVTVNGVSNEDQTAGSNDVESNNGTFIVAVLIILGIVIGCAYYFLSSWKRV